MLVVQNLANVYEEFGRQVIAPRVEHLYNAGDFDHSSWQELAKLGFWRIAVPCKYGGEGRTWQDFAIALEGLARTTGDLGFLLSLIAHAGLVRALSDFGTDAQKYSFLPSLLNGSIGATALTESTSGSDVASIRTGATETSNGYVLQGEKVHITNAPIADIILVLGRIPTLAKRDITLFLIDGHATGVHHGPMEHLFGNRTSPTGPLTFTNLTIDKKAVLGTPGEGLQLLYNIISLDRTLYGIIAAAYLEPLLAQAMAFAQTRKAFHMKIADHEYIQGRLTDIRLTIETTRSISHTALNALTDQDANASLLCSAAKLIGSEGLNTAMKHLMCIFGHRGYMEGSLSRAMQDALGTLIAGGTTEMQRKNIFNQMLREFQWREYTDETA